MRLRFQYISLTIVTLLLMNCCRKEEPCDDPNNPQCPNYDPCIGHEEITADFVVAQRAAVGGPEVTVWIPTYRIIAYTFSAVKFTANIEGATYKWTLGSETIYEKEFVRSFPLELVGQTIPVTLVVEKTPDFSCFPQDDGIDTLTKNLYIIDECDASILSEFRGAWDHAPLDTFNVKIAFYPDQFNTPCLKEFVVNFDQLNDSCEVDQNGFTDNYFSFYSEAAACSNARGKAYLEDDLEHIRIEYKIGNTIPSSDWPTIIFRGHKID